MLPRTIRIAAALLAAAITTIGPAGASAQFDDAIPAPPARANAHARAAAETAGDTGPHSVLVILLALADAPTQPITVDEARSAIFTAPDSAAALFAQQSSGRTTLTGRERPDGDVVGPFVLGVGAAGCPYDAIADAADEAARAAGVDPDPYRHVLYVLPHNDACGWGGLGQMPGRRAWTNGYVATRVVAHELGHNMDADHAASLRCVDDAGAPVAWSQTCTADEYGDPFDVMGLPARWMSSWHRAQLGQLGDGARQAIAGPGTYALAASSLAETEQPQLLLIPRKHPRTPVTTWYALERRSPLAPFDDFAPGVPVVGGVTIRLVPSLATASESYLIDTSPATPTVSDAPLMPGQAFTDGLYGITITAAAGGADVAMAPVVDDVPPAPPTALTRLVAGRAVTLTWAGATDDVGVDRYEIERNGTIVAATSSTSFVDRPAGNWPRAVYRVYAVDAAGNRTASERVTARRKPSRSRRG